MSDEMLLRMRMTPPPNTTCQQLASRRHGLLCLFED